MARPLRIEYPGALYHVTAFVFARQKIFRNHKEPQLFRRNFSEPAPVSMALLCILSYGQSLPDLACIETREVQPRKGDETGVYTPRNVTGDTHKNRPYLHRGGIRE